jgi:hypothetical protein
MKFTRQGRRAGGARIWLVCLHGERVRYEDGNDQRCQRATFLESLMILLITSVMELLV